VFETRSNPPVLVSAAFGCTPAGAQQYFTLSASSKNMKLVYATFPAADVGSAGNLDRSGKLHGMNLKVLNVAVRISRE
jgi:hypothetical protein